jgi:NAD(P)-dependent dehydrogenase (short-subunit alcohol dehydrogenase family)
MSETQARLMSLAGKVAMIAGGGGAIGSAIAATLLDAGATVLSIDRPGHDGPAGTRSIHCDVSRPDAVRELFAAIEATDDRLDILVHSVGIARDSVVWKMTDEAWSTVLDTNLDSAFFLVRGAVPLMRKAGGGAIALVSSINGERGKLGLSNYAASKAGLNALARTVAREVGRFGIRVNAVAPGWIETPLIEGIAPEWRQRAVDETALGRLGVPDDVARAVLFLCSDLSRHVTGQVLRVDGGQLIG